MKNPKIIQRHGDAGTVSGGTFRQLAGKRETLRQFGFRAPVRTDAFVKIPKLGQRPDDKVFTGVVRQLDGLPAAYCKTLAQFGFGLRKRTDFEMKVPQRTERLGDVADEFAGPFPRQGAVQRETFLQLRFRGLIGFRLAMKISKIEQRSCDAGAPSGKRGGIRGSIRKRAPYRKTLVQFGFRVRITPASAVKISKFVQRDRQFGRARFGIFFR